MNVVYARKSFNDASGGIFLAGPTPRSTNVKSWRPDALKLLETFKYNGTIYVPEDRGFEGCSVDMEYGEQKDWEMEGIRRCGVVMFWIPRELNNMPAYTTNIEFGKCVGLDSQKAAKQYVLAYPLRTPKMKYLHDDAEKQGQPICHTLEEAVKTAIDKSLEFQR